VTGFWRAGTTANAKISIQVVCRERSCLAPFFTALLGYDPADIPGLVVNEYAGFGRMAYFGLMVEDYAAAI
jgi:hypothetical protein